MNWLFRRRRRLAVRALHMAQFLRVMHETLWDMRGRGDIEAFAAEVEKRLCGTMENIEK